MLFLNPLYILGVEVKQETRAYLESQMITVGMRLKEDADDYRFITDPDLPPMKISDETIKRIWNGNPGAQVPDEFHVARLSTVGPLA